MVTVSTLFIVLLACAGQVKEGNDIVCSLFLLVLAFRLGTGFLDRGNGGGGVVVGGGRGGRSSEVDGSDVLGNADVSWVLLWLLTNAVVVGRIDT